MSCLRPRMRAWLVLSLLATHALACTTTVEGPSHVDPDLDPQLDESTSTMGDLGGGETGSMGPSECIESSDCVEIAEASAARLSEPLVLDRELIAAECVARDENDSYNCCYHEPAVCFCYYGWNGDQTRDRGNAMVLGNRADCDEYGRDRSCVSPASDFAGCDVEDESSCDTACDTLDARVTAHLAQSFDAEARTATCTESGACRIVLRIEDRCYASFSQLAKAYDCALSDEEILADAYPETTPASCTGDVCDGGAAVAQDAGRSE